jgi:hypothetical protein
MGAQGGIDMANQQNEINDGPNENGNGARRAKTVVLSGAQDVAGRVRMTASRAAVRLPGSMSDAQVAARGTQQALDQMSSETLLLGTGFWVGLTAGLWLKGANRLMVALVLLPAAAMANAFLRRRPGA